MLGSGVGKEQVGVLANQLSPELRIDVRGDQDSQDISKRERIGAREDSR